MKLFDFFGDLCGCVFQTSFLTDFGFNLDVILGEKESQESGKMESKSHHGEGHLDQLLGPSDPRLGPSDPRCGPSDPPPLASEMIPKSDHFWHMLRQIRGHFQQCGDRFFD